MPPRGALRRRGESRRDVRIVTPASIASGAGFRRRRERALEGPVLWPAGEEVGRRVTQALAIVRLRPCRDMTRIAPRPPSRSTAPSVAAAPMVASPHSKPLLDVTVGVDADVCWNAATHTAGFFACEHTPTVQSLIWAASQAHPTEVADCQRVDKGPPLIAARRVVGLRAGCGWRPRACDRDRDGRGHKSQDDERDRARHLMLLPSPRPRGAVDWRRMRATAYRSLTAR